LYACLRTLGLRVGETVLCNAVQFGLRREGTSFADGFTINESTLQHLELSTSPKSHCMFDNYVYVAILAQGGFVENFIV